MSINSFFKKLSNRNKEHAAYVDQNVFSNPEDVIKPLRELLKFEHNSAGYSYIYSHLGFAYLRLSEYKLAEIFYLRALDYKQNDVYSLANIAHASFELNKKDKAIYYGQLALQKKAELVGDKKEMADQPYNGSKNIIAFSLYGGLPKYCETAILNVEIAKKFFLNLLVDFMSTKLFRQKF